MKKFASLGVAQLCITSGFLGFGVEAVFSIVAVNGKTHRNRGLAKMIAAVFDSLSDVLATSPSAIE